jgi:hypothetical protein
LAERCACPARSGRLPGAFGVEADLKVDADQAALPAVGVGRADGDDVEHLAQQWHDLLALLWGAFQAELHVALHASIVVRRHDRDDRSAARCRVGG